MLWFKNYFTLKIENAQIFCGFEQLKLILNINILTFQKIYSYESKKRRSDLISIKSTAAKKSVRTSFGPDFCPGTLIV